MATTTISSERTKATSKGAAMADLAKVDNATAAAEAEPVTSAGPNWPPGFRPFHSLRDEESADGTRYNLLKIFCDTPEGRAYDGLVADEQRLAYMRAHHQDNTWHVQPDERILEDWNEGKCYVVKIRSPEGQALAEMDPPGGGEWEDEKSEGYRAWVDFFKKNASYVEELQPEDRPAACSAEGVGEI